MAAKVEETDVTYKELAQLEAEFDDVESEIVRIQAQMSQPLYDKRAELVARIPSFWPLVVEQAPPDLDEFIQPTDSAVLLTSLTKLSVSRFEIENGGKGEPRSVAIRWEFGENEYFEDRVLEKKFWYRHAKAGYGAFVSEPVEIKWKEGKDLTNGLLSMAKAVWDEEQEAIRSGASSATKKKEKKPLTAKQQALKDKIQSVGLGGQSFFCWFGYIGEDISAEESRMAIRREEENRARRKAGQPELEDEDEEEDDDEDDEDELEIFPDGEAVTLTIVDDLWPNALRYFITAQEDDILSDGDFEDMDMDEDEEMES